VNGKVKGKVKGENYRMRNFRVNILLRIIGSRKNKLVRHKVRPEETCTYKIWLEYVKIKCHFGGVSRRHGERDYEDVN
jgi:hypothetical protein